VTGQAFADDTPVEGVRTVALETVPAPNPVFWQTFELPVPMVSATIAATVLGTGVVRLNGHRIGEEALEPAVTDYDKTVLYRAWEVGHLLRAGSNEIRIEAGRERYSARGGDIWGWNLAPWHREPVAHLRLEATSAAGDTVVIVTDAAWMTAEGPVTEQLFRGEQWLLRDSPMTWEPVTVVAPPRGELRKAELPPVRALAPRPPRASVALRPDVVVHDFGEVMVGRIRCRITGSPGATVRVTSGEQLDGDGGVLCDNMLVAGKAQVDSVLIESSVSDHEWEPQFGYRGFRWFQIETAGDAVVERVRAIPLYTRLATVGEFTAGDPAVEWIDTATGRTFLNNLHGIPTDTPIYEKNGWTADAHLATEGLLHHFDLRSSFAKWVGDHRDAQASDGSIPQIIPTPGWGRASDPAWSASAVLIPWYLYREYGDLAELERSHDMVTRFADNIADLLSDGLWRHRTWSDWLAPGYGLPPEGMRPIGTLMAAHIFLHTALILEELGDDAASRYRAIAHHTGAAYHDAYFDSQAGVYAVNGVEYRQSLNILPLAFGLVPEREVAGVRSALITDLTDRTDGHLDCGAVAVRHILPVLSDANRDDLALTVLTRRSRPGWGAWFDAGESTLLESWDTDARSRNHYFLGSVASWIQQRVGGMRLTEPGWTRFEVAPIDDPRLTRASIRHRTPLGDAAVRWERGVGGWLLHVEVPMGSEAEIALAGHSERLPAGRHARRIPAQTPHLGLDPSAGKRRPLRVRSRSA
jgi:alpha-L-rhamnosidase